MDYEYYFFHRHFAMCFGVLLIYYIYARSDCFRHADGFTFSFALMQKNKVTKRKNQGYVSGPTPERPFWRWKMNSLRYTSLRQHFSAPPVHSHAHAPTPRPIFFHAKALRCWLWGLCLLAFGFYYLVLYTFMLNLWNIYQYRIDNSVFSHGILYT